jgi:hypothetical protein
MLFRNIQIRAPDNATNRVRKDHFLRYPDLTWRCCRVDDHRVHPMSTFGCGHSASLPRLSQLIHEYHSQRNGLITSKNRESKRLYHRVFSLNFQVFSFIFHLLMEVCSFVFYHSLEPVDPCFEDSHEGFLSDFVENVGDRAF